MTFRYFCIIKVNIYRL